MAASVTAIGLKRVTAWRRLAVLRTHRDGGQSATPCHSRAHVALLRRTVVQPRPGLAVVELSFFLLLFLMLSFGVFEFGRAFQTQIVVIQAAREGARVGSDALISTATIQAAVVNAARPYTIQTSDVTVTYPSGQVRVTATIPFTSTIWFVPNVNITGSVVGRRL